MSDWYRHKVDPLKYFDYFALPHDHVTYDPKMRREQYYMEFSSRHDSTMIFTYELFCNVVARLANLDVPITVGPMRLVSAMGQVLLPRLSETRTYPGMRERVRIYFRSDAPLKMRETIVQPRWPEPKWDNAMYRSGYNGSGVEIDAKTGEPIDRGLACS